MGNSSNKGYISAPFRYALFSKSCGKCNICKDQLIQEKEDEEPYSIANFAHIKGERKGSARYDASLSDSERNAYNNLILLCPTCHTKIDKNEEQYTVDFLQQQKAEHEMRIYEAVRSEIPNINFDELEVIIKYLNTNTPISNEDDEIILTPPRQKIDKNNLSKDVESLITQGMAKVSLVSSYLNSHPDVNFSENLRLVLQRSMMN